jgi:hypothetical protein
MKKSFCSGIHIFEIQTPIAPIVHPKMNSGKEFPPACAALRRDESARQVRLRRSGFRQKAAI